MTAALSLECSFCHELTATRNQHYCPEELATQQGGSRQHFSQKLQPVLLALAQPKEKSNDSQ